MNMKAMCAIALTLMIAVPIGLGYILASEEEEVTAWETTTQSNISNLLLNHVTPYYGAYTSPSNNNIVLAGNGVTPNYVRTGSTVTSSPIYDSDFDYEYFSSTEYVDFSNEGYYSIDGNMLCILTFGDGSTVNATGGVFHYSSGVYEIGNTTYTGVQNIKVKAVTGGSIMVERYTPTSQYGVAAYGWTLDSFYGGTWMNGQTNESVTMMVDANVESGYYFSVTFGTNAFSIAASIANGGASVFVSDTEYPLGDYTKFQVVITKDSATVYGLKSWPTMGANATTYNSVAVDLTDFNVDKIRIRTVNSSAIFRVDSTQVQMGAFPSTLDYTLDLASLYPDSMMSVKLNSVGVYGDALQIGNTSYAVTDGTITVDGKKIGLKGALISFLPNEDDELVGSINGRELGTFDELPTITFGGEWSLTAIAYKVEEVSTTNMTWNAGGFGLDKEGFAAAGLITAGAVFVALGMQGRASGTKIGLLLLMCGGAAFAYFSFL